MPAESILFGVNAGDFEGLIWLLKGVCYIAE